MKKLDKATLERLAKMREEVRSLQDDLGAEVETFNEKVAELFSGVEAIRVNLNEKIQEANTLIEEIHGDMESFFDEKSEKWQEGDSGQEFQSWMQEWETELEEIDELDIPEPLEVSLEVADTFDQFPEEINE